MNIVLTAVDAGLSGAWTRFCGEVAGVRVHHGSILDVECDAVVSPANSFGFMDGGVDLLYLERFGPQIQDRVRKAIWEHHGGELVVGNAVVVETGDAKIPFLIAAPTMRVPMILPQESTAAYLAARAVFLLLKRGKFLDGSRAGQDIGAHVKTVAFPGLGTGVGRMGPATCAHQVRAALDDVVLGGFEMPRSWAEASERHQLLYTTKLKRLQHEQG